MLMTRIKTAAVLLVLVGLVLFVLPAWSWVIFASLIAGLGFWEWLRMTPTPYLSALPQMLVAAALGFALAALVLLAPMDWMAWVTGIAVLLAAVFWLLVVPLWLVRRWTLRQPLLHFVLGMILVVPAWCALVSLKPLPPQPGYCWRPWPCPGSRISGLIFLVSNLVSASLRQPLARVKPGKV